MQKTSHAINGGSARGELNRARTDRAKSKEAESWGSPSDSPLLLDIHQLAKALNVRRITVEKWTTTRRIPSLKLGRVLRYDLKKVMSALEAYERKAV